MRLATLGCLLLVGLAFTGCACKASIGYDFHYSGVCIREDIDELSYPLE